MKHFMLTSFILLCCTFFAGCSENNEPVLRYKTQGFVKGTLTGTAVNDTYLFDENFNYNQFKLDDASIYSLLEDGGYRVTISRHDYTTGARFIMTVDLKKEALNDPFGTNLVFSFVKNEKTRVIRFSMYPKYLALEEYITFSDFYFDPISGRVKGKLTTTNNFNSTQSEATLSCEFDVIALKQVW